MGGSYSTAEWKDISEKARVVDGYCMYRCVEEHDGLCCFYSCSIEVE